MWSVWLTFCDCGFHSVSPLMDEDKRLVQASWWEGLAVAETGSCALMDRASSVNLQSSFLLMGGAVFPPCSLAWGQTMVGITGSNGDLLPKDLCQHIVSPRTVVFSAPDPTAGHCQPTPPQRLLDTHRQVWLSLLWGHCSSLLGPVCSRFCCAL